MTEQQILELATKFNLVGEYSWEVPSVERTKTGWEVRFGGLPQLPLYIALAKAAGIELESIRTETNDHGPGCETCGYGGGVDFTVCWAQK